MPHLAVSRHLKLLSCAAIISGGRLSDFVSQDGDTSLHAMFFNMDRPH